MVRYRRREACKELSEYSRLRTALKGALQLLNSAHFGKVSAYSYGERKLPWYEIHGILFSKLRG